MTSITIEDVYASCHELYDSDHHQVVRQPKTENLVAGDVFHLLSCLCSGETTSIDCPFSYAYTGAAAHAFKNDASRAQHVFDSAESWLDLYRITSAKATAKLSKLAWRMLKAPPQYRKHATCETYAKAAVYIAVLHAMHKKGVTHD